VHNCFFSLLSAKSYLTFSSPFSPAEVFHHIGRKTFAFGSTFQPLPINLIIPTPAERTSGLDFKHLSKKSYKDYIREPISLYLISSWAFSLTLIIVPVAMHCILRHNWICLFTKSLAPSIGPLMYHDFVKHFFNGNLDVKVLCYRIYPTGKNAHLKKTAFFGTGTNQS
jgi:hypothetical protein